MITVRPLPKHQLEEALALCRRVFLSCDAADYAPEERKKVLDFLEPAQIRPMLASGLLTFYGAYLEDTLTGAGALRQMRHISLLFVKQENHRCGIGTALLSHMMQCCHRAGNDEVTVQAAPFAKPFYLARGFQSCENPGFRPSQTTPTERMLGIYDHTKYTGN